MSLQRIAAAGLVAAWLLAAMAAPAGAKVPRYTGQTLYVPVYSQIFHGDRQRHFNLAVTLSVRNSDIHHGIHITRVHYYDGQGKLNRKYQETPLVVGPLAAKCYVVKESEVDTGPLASFLVSWESDAPVSPPVVNAIMIGTANNQGLSFSFQGRVVAETP
jgi:hypothetical protein